MANLDDIEDVAITVVGTGIYYRLVSRYGSLNVLFYGALIITSVVLFFLWGMINILRYDPENTFDRSKVGDSLFISKTMMNDTAKDVSAPFYMLVRPMTLNDINKMHLTLRQQIKMKAELPDSGAKPETIFGNFRFSVEKAFKYKTSYVGKILKKDSMMVGTSLHSFIIKPNYKLLISAQHDPIPKGYIVASNDFYGDAPDFSLEEFDAFKHKDNSSQKHSKHFNNKKH